jgi:hypothetical protein
MPKRLRNLRISEVALVDKGANQHAHILLWKRDDGDTPDASTNPIPTNSEIPAGSGADDGDGMPPPPVDDSAASASGRTEDKSMADNAALEARLAELEAKLDATEKAKAEAEAKVTETEKLAKAEASRIEKTEKELADLRKSHEEAVEKAERMEFAKRAEAEFPYTPGTAEEKGEVLRAVHKLADGPVKDRMLKSMKEADGAFASLMREVGKSGKPGNGTAQAELDAEATKLMQAEKLSKAEALKRVMHSNETLAKRYRDELEGALDGN